MQKTYLPFLIFLVVFFLPAVGLAADPVSPSEPVSLAQLGPTAAEAVSDYDEDEEMDEIEVCDPLIVWNTAWYHFNDKLYYWALKPVARGYKKVLPEPARIGVRNFFTNLTTPIRLVNCLLQGKINGAGHELGRFLINTTGGILGFGDPATDLGLVKRDEDLGQTLGSYGVGNGLYLVWPFFGPSTLRDTIGLAGDYFLDPINHLDEFGTRLAVNSVERVNDTSLRLGDYETLKEAALDPYVALRDAYLQHRSKKVGE